MKKQKRDSAEDLIEELRDLLAIDKHSLDDEIQAQPQLFFKIGEAFVHAAAHRDFCKEEIKRTDADLAARHRKLIEKSGARATDAGVASAVAADQKHHDAVDAHLKASVKADLLLALKESFHQRSYMLRDLAALAIANYYEKSAMGDTSNSREIRANKNIDRMDNERRRRRERE